MPTRVTEQAAFFILTNMVRARSSLALIGGYLGRLIAGLHTHCQSFQHGVASSTSRGYSGGVSFAAEKVRSSQVK